MRIAPQNNIKKRIPPPRRTIDMKNVYTTAEGSTQVRNEKKFAKKEDMDLFQLIKSCPKQHYFSEGYHWRPHNESSVLLKNIIIVLKGSVFELEEKINTPFYLVHERSIDTNLEIVSPLSISLSQQAIISEYGCFILKEMCTENRNKSLFQAIFVPRNEDLDPKIKTCAIISIDSGSRGDTRIIIKRLLELQETYESVCQENSFRVLELKKGDDNNISIITAIFKTVITPKAEEQFLRILETKIDTQQADRTSLRAAQVSAPETQEDTQPPQQVDRTSLFAAQVFAPETREDIEPPPANKRRCNIL